MGILIDFTAMTREEADEVLTVLDFDDELKSFFMRIYEPVPLNPQLCILVDKLPWLDMSPGEGDQT